MRIFGKRRKKRSAYQIEMDRLLEARLNLDPLDDAAEYDAINKRIKDLQEQKTTDKLNRRRMTPEGRRTAGTIVGGLALMGANFFMESKGSMLTGRRAKDADNIMSTIIRTITNIMSKGG